jgi:2-polyprenyl-3-methyl-5-hydroxy-6-metoxy-1,4-benzoquinol methylase
MSIHDAGNAETRGEPNPDFSSVCKICGSSNLTVFAHTAKCGDCGVFLFWPYPKGDSTLLQEGTGKNWSRENVLIWYSMASFYNHTNFTRMLRFTMGESFKKKPLEILDYGGGGGQFALVCKSHFPEATVYITDISDVSLLAEWKPLNTQIPFKDFTSDQRKFDGIFLNDVFEHVSDPLFVLKQLAGKLKPGGLIFIDTPKQFWIYPVTRLVSKALYTKVLRATVSTAHLQIWTRKSFELAVNKCGLSISKYAEESEYTMPAAYYMNNMGIKNPLTRLVGRVFYRNAKHIDKIMCVLSVNKV